MSNCLKCGGPTEVKNSRPTASSDLRRRRQCKSCGHRHTTLEIPYGPHPRSIEVALWAAEHNRDIFMEENNG